MALAGLVAIGCADSASTTTVALAVDKTGFVVATTTAAPPPTDRCTVPPDTEVAPAWVERRCDAASGWRFAEWIGESGDGIIQLEHDVDGAWAVVAYGPYCGGVAAITHAALRDLGVPDALVQAWGVDASMCPRAEPQPPAAASVQRGGARTLSE